MANSSAEKRKCKRYNVPDFMVAIYDNRLGRVINISESGLAIKLIDSDFESLPEAGKTSLLTRTRGFLIEGLPLKLVRKEVLSSTPRNSKKLQTIGVKFNISDAIQLCKIKQYLFLLS
ncbi:MAG: PilZ domain-containing protein [Desulfobulbaceae bacterium]|uniref:PilZ domain-containing protein n=1 Tax=Candidatus Desulfobia pelagia TaxID=2841692 RepID=A0A8J6NBG0_9BACT|nr:PilZ domain-containing protein [Candidatus Desulfobia pelagia]